MLSERQFNNCFKRIENNANGNCLFETMEYLLSGTLYEYNHGYTRASEIREMVGQFYKDFDKDIDYPINTIEYNIKIGILFDNMDDAEEAHDINICNDKVWASMTDVLICSLLFNVNINLYKYFEKKYHLEKITSQYNFMETINILYNGVNHFEALECN